jgi:hypothetical protein
MGMKPRVEKLECCTLWLHKWLIEMRPVFSGVQKYRNFQLWCWHKMGVADKGMTSRGMGTRLEIFHFVGPGDREAVAFLEKWSD